MKPIRINEEVFRNLNQLNYTMEFKFDGMRIVPIIGSNRVQTFTRLKQPMKVPGYISNKLNDLQLPAGSVFDGEIWSLTQRGGWSTLPPGQCMVTLWDIMRLGTKDLTQCPIEERRSILYRLIPDNDIIRVSEVLPLSSLDEIRREAFRAREGHRSGSIHGVVLKKNGSIRRDHATRSFEHPDWLKVVWF